ncbi:hypothetical protein ABW19_dt0208143 [Dactylella cylindrospora]|nr:hypothetical protein ABW19_dt0208143 [Dactylella cylindrospora]
MEDPTAVGEEDNGLRHVSEFECSNLDQVSRTADRVRSASTEPLKVIGTSLSQQREPNLPRYFARSQALKLLLEIPQVAEKKSRQLVPLFLEWAQQETDDLDDTLENGDDNTPSLSKWGRNDRMAMLKVFAKFHNPKVLYKADLVFNALLDLLTSGDTTMQTAALECIFTWKLPAVRPYEENLTSLLNESKFRDEITNFIQVEQNETIIQENHREKLTPILLRVLYGRSLSRKNSGSVGKMESRRISILASLANFNPSDIRMFVEITIGDLGDLDFVNKQNPNKFAFELGSLDNLRVSPRKQLGFVNMIEDMLKQLGKSLGHMIETIFDNLIACIVNASQLASKDTVSEFDSENLKAYRMIRQIGFRCINEIFGKFPELEWSRYIPAFFQALVEPRLRTFAAEHSMSKSGLLKTFVTWSAHANTVLFLEQYNPQVLQKISDCLAFPTVSNDVVLEIIVLVQNLVARVEEGDTKILRKRLITPYIDSYLHKFGGILEKSLPKETLENCVEVVSQLAAYVESTAETKKLLEISLFLLSQPTKRVNPKAKSDILKIVYHILPTLLEGLGDDLTEKTFKTVATQFSFFRDRDSRELLAKVLTVFAEKDEALEEVARLCEDMNTYSMKALDEPDFNKRLSAFAEINEDKYQVLLLKQWIPIVHNMLYFIRDQEELTTRTNASYCLRRFVERAAKSANGVEGQAYADALSKIVLPAIRNGLRDASELIRMEYVNVLGHIIKECETSEVDDLKVLLVDGDEEANFFYNILHIQQHRRSRAIRRLAEAAEGTPMRSSNLAHYLIPLIEHFIFDQDEGAHNLATDAIKTLVVLATHVEWPQYRALFKRYLAHMKEIPGEEKLSIRVIGGMAEALLNASQRRAQMRKSADGDIVMGGTGALPPALTISLPSPEKLEGDILETMLPQLRIFLQQKDEATVSLRVPVAVSIVKLMRVLSDEALSRNLPPVLTNLCHILRSRDQTSRDLTRNTLTEITTLLGPKYFGFVLKELRGALLRGYQLHVLSYTVHAIMVSVVPTWGVGSLDYCTSGIMEVVMDDIFGVTASEKEAEGYTNKMKEIKTNKSYDTAELLTSITTLTYLGDIIKPIRAILLERLNHSIVKKIDELFRRIGLGLAKNQAVNSRDVLVFSYEIVEESYKAAKVEEKVKEMSIRDEIQQRFIINLRSAKSQSTSERKNIYWFKLLRFALDTVRSVVQKHEELMVPENLDAWVKVIGDNIQADEDEVKISCIRLLTTIIKVPLSKIDKSAYVFVRDCYHILQDSPNTNSELAQASLKLLGSILKERRNVEVKPTILSYVLERIQPDLVEPDRQGLTFNFIKAVLSRKIVVPEVYEVIKEISKIMIQNHSKGVRESCRGLYFQFLMDYPQSKKKLDNQLKFLIANLGYEHQEGRESVLEAIHLLLTKVGDDLIQEILEAFFPALVIVVANDEAEKCREMALVLMKKIFERADQETMASLLGKMREWLGRDQKEILRRISFRLWLVYTDVVGKAIKSELGFITGKILEAAREAMIDEDEELMDEDVEMQVTWEQLYYALQLWAKLVPLFPDEAKSGRYGDLWTATRACEGYPHAKVQLMATKLTGLFFSEFKDDLSKLPLQSGKGLEVTSDDLYQVAKSCSGLLLSGDLTDELGVQAVRNLVFVGRCFQASGLIRTQPTKPAKEPEEAKEEEWGGIEENDTEQAEGSASEDEQDGEQRAEDKSALSWLVHKVNGVIRNDDMIQRKNVTGKKFALQWVAAMTQIMSVEDLTSLAVKIILPLYNLIEAENEALKDLKPIAQEVLQMMSTKMGTTAYAQAYATVRSTVAERRRVRRHKRSIQLVTDPERAAKRKMRKHERSKESKREKGKVFRDARRAKYM